MGPSSLRGNRFAPPIFRVNFSASVIADSNAGERPISRLTGIRPSLAWASAVGGAHGGWRPDDYLVNVVCWRCHVIEASRRK